MNFKPARLVILFLVLLNSNAFCQNCKTISSFHHIESVVTDGKFYYVAEIGTDLEPIKKDGNGRVYRLTTKGKVLDSGYVKEVLNSPKGLAIINEVLFIADIDRLVAIDLKSGKKVYEIDLSKEASFLNDIAVWDDSTLYISATDKSKIFKVNIISKSFAQLNTDYTVAGTNGLFADNKNKRLFVNGLGSEGKPNGVFGFVDITTGKFTRLTEREGIFDGIILKKNTLYVSDWVSFDKHGIILAINLIDSSVTILPLKGFFAGPADFLINKNKIIIPQMLDGTLTICDLK